jgi:hypothetical protein
MSKKHDVYPTKYFRAADLPDGWSLVAQVEMCRREEFDGKHDGEKIDKLVCYFHGHKSGLVVGPVVWDQIAEVMAANGVDKLNADDYEYWPNHWLELHRDRTPFGGKLVPCIRVRVPSAIPASKAKARTKKRTDMLPPDPLSDEEVEAARRRATEYD